MGNSMVCPLKTKNRLTYKGRKCPESRVVGGSGLHFRMITLEPVSRTEWSRIQGKETSDEC